MIINPYRFAAGGAVSPSTANLIAWWGLGDSPPRADSSGNGYTLSPFGTPTTVAGKNGDATDFDGTGDFLGRSDATSPNLTGAQTWACWVNIDTFPTSSFEAIMTKYDGTGDQRGVYLGINSSNKLVGIISPDGFYDANEQATSTASLSTNTWYHIALVFDPSTATQLYIDGSADGAATTPPASCFDNTAALQIGAEGSGGGASSQYLDGTVDEACIFDKALTSDEVLWLASGNYFADL